MQGTVILSHGLESGPDATKVSAMAKVALARGWHAIRPDFRDIDATRNVDRIGDRVARLLAHVPEGERNLVLAGSSMGAFASARASLEVGCRALFLLAPPLALPGYAAPFAPAAVPLEIVHGWDDELIPAAEVIAWAHARRATLHLVDDSHRLSAHVDWIAARFDTFLADVEARG